MADLQILGRQEDAPVLLDQEGHAVERHGDRGRLRCDQALPGEPGCGGAALGVTLQDDFHLRVRPGQVHPLDRPGDLVAGFVQGSGDQLPG